VFATRRCQLVWVFICVVGLTQPSLQSDVVALSKQVKQPGDELSTQFQLVPRLRICEAICPLSYIILWRAAVGLRSGRYLVIARHATMGWPNSGCFLWGPIPDYIRRVSTKPKGTLPMDCYLDAVGGLLPLWSEEGIPKAVQDKVAGKGQQNWKDQPLLLPKGGPLPNSVGVIYENKNMVMGPNGAQHQE
jgi:hypothetical protein